MKFSFNGSVLGTLAVVVVAGVLAVGCKSDKPAEEPKGPAEKTGEKIDESADKAEDKAEETMDKAGDKVEKATDDEE